jgi:hypothetical protein
LGKPNDAKLGDFKFDAEHVVVSTVSTLQLDKQIAASRTFVILFAFGLERLRVRGFRMRG